MIYMYIYICIYGALINLVLFATAVRFFLLIMCGIMCGFVWLIMCGVMCGTFFCVCAEVLLRACPTHLSLSSAKPSPAQLVSGVLLFPCWNENRKTQAAPAAARKTRGGQKGPLELISQKI